MFQERSHTRAIFPSASGDLPVPTSWRGIIANTQAPSHSNAKFVSVALLDLITLPYIWNDIYQRSKSNAIMPTIIKPITTTHKIIDINSSHFLYSLKKIGSALYYIIVIVFKNLCPKKIIFLSLGIGKQWWIWVLETRVSGFRIAIE